MSSLPFFKFFPSDWVSGSRMLLPETKGILFDLICALWQSAEPGVLRMPLAAWGRMVGESPEAFEQALREIVSFDLCQCAALPDGNLQISCRRVIRDYAKISAEVQARSAQGESASRARWGKATQRATSTKKKVAKKKTPEKKPVLALVGSSQVADRKQNGGGDLTAMPVHSSCIAF